MECETDCDSLLVILKSSLRLKDRISLTDVSFNACTLNSLSPVCDQNPFRANAIAPSNIPCARSSSQHLAYQSCLPIIQFSIKIIPCMKTSLYIYTIPMALPLRRNQPDPTMLNYIPTITQLCLFFHRLIHFQMFI